MYDLLDDSAGTSNSDVLVAAGAVLIELQPILYASFAKQLITVIAFLGLTRDLEADLAEDVLREFLAYLEATNAVGVVAYRLHIQHLLNSQIALNYKLINAKFLNHLLLN